MAIVLFQVPIQGVNSLQRNRWIFHFDNRNIENWKYVKPKALFDTLISRATSALSVRWGFCTFFLDINLQVNHSSQNITRFGSLVITQKNNCTYTFSCNFQQNGGEAPEIMELEVHLASWIALCWAKHGRNRSTWTNPTHFSLDFESTRFKSSDPCSFTVIMSYLLSDSITLSRSPVVSTEPKKAPPALNGHAWHRQRWPQKCLRLPRRSHRTILRSIKGRIPKVWRHTMDIHSNRGGDRGMHLYICRLKLWFVVGRGVARPLSKEFPIEAALDGVESLITRNSGDTRGAQSKCWWTLRTKKEVESPLPVIYKNEIKNV